MNKLNILLIIFIAVFLFSSYQFYTEYTMSQDDIKNFDEINKIYQEYQENNESDESPITPLIYENDDVVGWVSIENTLLDYPVMHTPENPEYYIRRNFYKEYSASGTPFIAEGCTLEPRSDQLIIYSHNNRNGTMFGSLTKYDDYQYYQENKEIYLTIHDQEETYEIFAVIYLDVTVDNGHLEFYNFINASSEEQYHSYIDSLKQQSIYDTDVDVNYGDKLLTLAACSYHSENGRLIVVAKKI